jgi:hypothetical protein
MPISPTLGRITVRQTYHSIIRIEMIHNENICTVRIAEHRGAFE